MLWANFGANSLPEMMIPLLGYLTVRSGPGHRPPPAVALVILDQPLAQRLVGERLRDRLGVLQHVIDGGLGKVALLHRPCLGLELRLRRALRRA